LRITTGSLVSKTASDSPLFFSQPFLPLALFEVAASDRFQESGRRIDQADRRNRAVVQKQFDFFEQDLEHRSEIHGVDDSQIDIVQSANSFEALLAALVEPGVLDCGADLPPDGGEQRNVLWRELAGRLAV